MHAATEQHAGPRKAPAHPHLHVAPRLPHHPHWRPVHWLPAQRAQQQRLLCAACCLHSAHLLGEVVTAYAACTIMLNCLAGLKRAATMIRVGLFWLAKKGALPAALSALGVSARAAAHLPCSGGGGLHDSRCSY